MESERRGNLIVGRSRKTLMFKKEIATPRPDLVLGKDLRSIGTELAMTTDVNNLWYPSFLDIGCWILDIDIFHS